MVAVMYKATICTDEEDVELNQLHPTPDMMLVYAVGEAESAYTNQDWTIRVMENNPPYPGYRGDLMRPNKVGDDLTLSNQELKRTGLMFTVTKEME